MKERIFRFKQFSVCHSKSAMKVGVDGVLLGAWADVGGKSVLDVGTGCGLIALMAAQRNVNAHILGIDISNEAIEEARSNINLSPWHDRVEAVCVSFQRQLELPARFDCIISNPPFFNSGITDPSTEREKSRHIAELSPEIILQNASRILSDNGVVSLITPADYLTSLKAAAETGNLHCAKLSLVATVEGKKPKRLLSQWKRHKPDSIVQNVINIEDGKFPDRHFSAEYQSLCSPFYLLM